MASNAFGSVDVHDSRSTVIRLTEYQFSSVLVDVQAGALSIPVSSLPTWSWCTCSLREIHRPSEGGLELQHHAIRTGSIRMAARRAVL